MFGNRMLKESLTECFVIQYQNSEENKTKTIKITLHIKEEFLSNCVQLHKVLYDNSYHDFQRKGIKKLLAILSQKNLK